MTIRPDRNTYENKGIVVGRNHEEYQDGASNAVYLTIPARVTSDASFSTQEARDIAAALIAAADSFDALKPDPQTEFVAKLESLGLGAVVEGRVHAVRPVKIHRGNWIASRGAVFGASTIDHIEYEIISEGVK